MRSIVLLGGSSALAVAWLLQGCSALPDTCENRGTCTGQTMSPSTSDNGADGSVDPPEASPDDGEAGIQSIDSAASCDETSAPSEDPCVITDALGVFVSPSGDDAGDGTRAHPLATMGAALTLAKSAGKRVYACTGTFASALTIGVNVDGAAIFGGIDCASGAYTGTKTVIAPTAPGYALTLDALSSARLEDLEIDARDAPTAGGSSIAVFARNAQRVVLRRVAVRAGNAKDGAAGGTVANYAGPAPAGSGATSAAGAAPGKITCVDGTSSAGGVGATPNGAVAGDGSAAPSVGGPNGGLSGNTTCTDATNGANALGVQAGGAGASSSGTVDANGWSSSKGGGNGGNGKPGQGGGGGGSKAAVSLGGGGGGAGGCGGGGGLGGQTGGSSIAILAVTSTIALTSCALTAGQAGNGGSGGAGQPAQAGGDLGAGVCNGAAGGAGGAGSGGGGGAGGISVGIMWGGSPPTIDGQLTPEAGALASVTVGAAGNKGAKGTSGAAAGSGARGGDGTDVVAEFAKAVAQSL